MEPTYAGRQANVSHYFLELFPWDENDLKNTKLIDHISKLKDFMDRLIMQGLIELDEVYKELGTLQSNAEYRWLNTRPINGAISKKGYDLLKEERERIKDRRRFCTTLTISITTAIVAIVSLIVSILTYQWNTNKKSESIIPQLQSLDSQVQNLGTQLKELTRHLQSDSSVKNVRIVK